MTGDQRIKNISSGAAITALLFTVLLTVWASLVSAQESIVETNINDPDGRLPVITIRREPKPVNPNNLPLVDLDSLKKIKVDERNKDAVVVGRIRPRPGEVEAGRPPLGPVNFRKLGQIRVDPDSKEAVAVGRLRPEAKADKKPTSKEAVVLGKIGLGFQTPRPGPENFGNHLSPPNREAVMVSRIGPNSPGVYPFFDPNDPEALKKLKLDSTNKEAIVVGRLRPSSASVEAVPLGRLQWPGTPSFNRQPSTAPDNFYMFRGEDGVMNLTDAPTDPRYRPFQVTIRFQVAQSGGGRSKLNLDLVRPYIQMAAIQYNLDPALIAAVIKAESAFDPKAVSWAGAQGLMQLIPSTARLVGCLDPFNPQDNIMGGSRYLRMMLTRFNGDLTKAVAAYNCGPERVAKVGGIPEIRETQNYVKIVLANYEKYRLQFAFAQ